MAVTGYSGAMDSISQSSSARRMVAIVGRPNVGKSALFNRLVHRRMAIVHPESGVTRDRVSARADWEGQWFELIDTGGIGVSHGEKVADPIAAGTYQQADVAIQDATVIVFVVDLTAGITPLDQHLAARLHASGKKVLLAANKTDDPAQEPRAAEFERLGYPVFPVSALNNRGLTELMRAALQDLPPAPRPEEVPALRVAIVGRPNVGKSSFVNRLLRSDRVIVSPVPGTTRDSVEVPFAIGSGPQARHYLLIDTAGMRKAGKVDTVVETFSIMRAEHSIAHADVAVLMLDAEDGPTMQDMKVADRIIEANIGCLLIVNKWDLAEGKVTQRAYLDALRKTIPFLDFAPVVFVSAQSGYNIRRCIDTIDHVAEQTNRKISTGVLNQILRDAFERVQPPYVKGRRFKMYYATQTGTRPVWIKMFVNYPDCRTPAYEAYIIRCLREALGLEGAPIRLHFVGHHESDQPEAASGGRGAKPAPQAAGTRPENLPPSRRPRLKRRPER